MKNPAVHIMTNKTKHVLYTGVTSNLAQRIYQHREGICEGFSKKYHCKTVVFYQLCDTMITAITREKQIKKYSRETKEKLINKANPSWEDLYFEIIS